MRIAFLTEFVYPYHVGGVEKRYYEIGRRLAARGHDIDWYAMRHWPPAVAHNEGIRLRGATAPFGVYSATGNRSIVAGLRLSAALTKELLKARERYDVVDSSLFPYFHIFGARLVRPKTPMVVTWHEFWGQHWREYLGAKGRVGEIVEQLATKVPNRIVPISDMARDALIDAGVPSAHLDTIYNGIDSSRLAGIRAADDKADVLHFGRLKNHKNVKDVLAAVAGLCSAGRRIRFDIIGDGPEADSLHAYASTVTPPGTVRFLGAIEDEQELFARVAAARVVVQASSKEGGGSITVLEANACGTPVVAVPHPLGIDRSLVSEGVNGWWASDTRVETLAQAIATALDDDEEDRARLCRSFAQKYDWDGIAEQYEETYARASG